MAVEKKVLGKGSFTEEKPVIADLSTFAKLLPTYNGWTEEHLRSILKVLKMHLT